MRNSIASRFRKMNLLETIVESTSLHQILVTQAKKTHKKRTFSAGFSGNSARAYQKYIIHISKGVFQDPYTNKILFSNHHNSKGY